MTWFTINLSNNSSEMSSSPEERRKPTDADILDAYSTAVIHVVESVSPAVISATGKGAEARMGSGSGFIITPDGYAVTNSHVVAGRRRLIAETNDGDKVDAEVVGDDPATDIALLRLAARDSSIELAILRGSQRSTLTLPGTV